MQLWVLGGHKLTWLPDASKKLFRSAVTRGWDHDKGGLFYTLDFENRPALRYKIWWPATEAIGAAAFIAEHDADPFFEDWYRRVWSFSTNHFIDPANGGWFPELGEDQHLLLARCHHLGDLAQADELAALRLRPLTIVQPV